MDFYQISDLERFTGIKAHTIRIWEKRYEIIIPKRSDTNIRYYDDEQLKKILNITSLIAQGFKISKIAVMTDKQLREEIEHQSQITNISGQFNIYINKFIIAMLDFDEHQFNSLFEEIVAKFGVEDSIINVIYPFLNTTGVLWLIDKAIPIQEHFASTIIKRKMFSLVEQLAIPPKSSKSVLLFLPSNEWHEISMLFAEYLIRSKGFNTINLGQNVPFVDIESVLRKKNPKYLLGFIISENNQLYIENLTTLLNKSFPKTICFLSGSAPKLATIKESKHIKLLYFPYDILKFL